MSEMHPALLPNGLKDLLPPEAEEEALIVSSLMHSFADFGYRRVKPPMVEFEESLLAPGPGQSLSKDTFRLMDPISRHMMGIRADTTAQIARIADSRLKDEVRPLRLSYAADVLRVNGSQLRPERQFCQVGCELIGAGDTRDDVEITLMALKALSDVNIPSLSVDLTIPTLTNIIFDHFKLDDLERNNIETLIQKRDRDGLVNLKSKAANLFIELLDCSGSAEKAIQGLNKVKLPKLAKKSVSYLKSVYEELVEALAVYNLNNVKITIDLIERRGFEYQNGVSFTLFSPEVRGELGRGGRYQIGSQEEASGFTLYMDSVRQAANILEEIAKQSVDADASWEEIKKLQDQKIQVSRSRK